MLPEMRQIVRGYRRRTERRRHQEIDPTASFEYIERETSVAARDSRIYLAWIAVAFAVLEVGSVVLIGVPAILGLVFAGLFALGAYRLRRGDMGGVILVGVLCLIEVLGVPFYTRPTILHVLLQAGGLMLGVAGVALAALAFRNGRVVSPR